MEKKTEELIEDRLELLNILGTIDGMPVPECNKRPDSEQEIAFARRKLGPLPDGLKKLFFHLPDYPDSILDAVWDYEFRRVFGSPPANQTFLISEDWTVYLSRRHIFLA